MYTKLVLFCPQQNAEGHYFGTVHPSVCIALLGKLIQFPLLSQKSVGMSLVAHIVGMFHLDDWMEL